MEKNYEAVADKIIERATEVSIKTGEATRLMLGVTGVLAKRGYKATKDKAEKALKEQRAGKCAALTVGVCKVFSCGYTAANEEGMKYCPGCGRRVREVKSLERKEGI